MLRLFFIILILPFSISIAQVLDTCNTNLLSIQQLNFKYVEALQKEKSKKIELIKKVSGGIDGQDILYYRGIPPGVSFIKGSEISVARHYSLHKEKILKDGFLQAGPRSYIVPEAHQRDLYVDLTGVFFTLPEFDPERLWLGFNKQTPYIDFKLPDDIVVLKLAEGNYLIPGPPSRQQWLIDRYHQELEEGRISLTIEDYLKTNSKLYEIEAFPLLIPIIKITPK